MILSYLVNSYQVSSPLLVALGSVITVSPRAGATATVEYTTNDMFAVQNGSATYAAWPKGAVTSATTAHPNKTVYVRVTAVGGIVDILINDAPTLDTVAGFRADWGTIGGVTSGAAVSPLSNLNARTVGSVPQLNGAASTVVLTPSLTPVSVASTATSIEQNVAVTGLVAGDIITNVVYTGGTQTSGITLVGWRMVNTTTMGMMFKCTGGPLTPGAGVYTITVARMTGGTNLPHLTLTGTGANTAALTATTLSGTVQTIPLTNAKVRVCSRLSDWSLGGTVPSNAGLYGPWAATTTTQGNGGQTGTVMRYDFVTDANKVELIMKGTPTVGSLNLVRVIVDGKIVTPDAMPLPGNSKVYRTLIDFTQGGGATPTNVPRSIRIEVCSSAAMQMGDIIVGILDSIFTPPQGAPYLISGDSFVEGYLLPQQWTGFAHTLGYMMGWDNLYVSGVGGTGYLKKVPGTTLTWRERITDITAVAPKVVVILGSINDTIGSVYTAAQVQAEATLYYQALTAALPNTPIFVFGVQIMQPARAASSALNALATAQNNAIKAAVTGLANVYFIDIVTDPWITGSGTSAATTGDGNADRFVLADGTHMTQAGHDYYAQRGFAAIRALL